MGPDKILINDPAIYSSEEIKEECQKETTQNNVDEPIASSLRDNQIKEDKQKIQ